MGSRVYECSVEGCDRPKVARELCSTHYARLTRYGDVLRGGSLPPNPYGRCRVPGCEEPADKSRYCPSHRVRAESHGDPLAGRRARGSDPVPCAVARCDKPAVSHGLCDGHRKRQRAHGDPLGGRRSNPRDATPEERFWACVEVRASNECWPWVAALNYKGYGQFGLNRDGKKSVAAHRYSYELAHGPIPSGRQVHHVCENKACQNPSHLTTMEAGEHTLIGNNFSGRNARKTHCKRGHPLTPENSYGYHGRRQCKICAREKAREQHRRKGQ